MAGIKFSISSGLNDDVFGKSVAPIISFLEKREESPVEHQFYKKVFKEIKSNHYAEAYTAMTAMSDFLPTEEGGTIPAMNMQESFKKTIENVQWTGKFTITKRAMKEALLMDLENKPAQFIDAFHRAKENHAATLLGKAIAGDTSVKQGYYTFPLTTADGLALFSKVHKSAVAGKSTQTNKFSNAFSATMLSHAATKMQNFRGDQGEILSISPDTIIIPNIEPLKSEVLAAIGADKSPDTANNGFYYQYGMWNVLCWSPLNDYIGTSNTAPWILLDSKYCQRTNALVFQNRQDLEVDVFKSQNNKDTEWAGDAVFAGGFVDWRAICCGGLADGTNIA